MITIAYIILFSINSCALNKMPTFLGMSYINEPFTNSNELDDFLNHSVDQIERTREQIQSYNDIVDH